ncbi:hypothetical protein A3K01_00775 [candidate division WWE3 bacterium RIFOXYD1_FULL_43_17]|nr:MAG: hypothetical protein A3K01_00775 [candidate division WWE3 bacterium RIFOXYD1_FULL_43_17]
MIKSAGYAGIQALPIKFWSYKRIHEWEKDVISFEDAFNFGLPWKALLFGRRISPFFPQAILVAHHWQKGVAVEIHPELSTSIEEYLDFCANGGRFCWDTLHVRRRRRDGSSGIDDWEKLLQALPEGAVELIHVHPKKAEIPAFLNGASTEFREMLSLLGLKFPRVPAIIEIFPPLKSPKKTLGELSDVLTITKEWLG